MLTIKSRFDTERVFTKISDDLIKFQAYEVMYCTCSGNDTEDLDAIDPDGGPFIHKGYSIKLNDEIFIVQSISDIVHIQDDEYLEILLHVKKEN